MGISRSPSDWFQFIFTIAPVSALNPGAILTFPALTVSLTLDSALSTLYFILCTQYLSLRTSYVFSSVADIDSPRLRIMDLPSHQVVDLPVLSLLRRHVNLVSSRGYIIDSDQHVAISVFETVEPDQVNAIITVRHRIDGIVNYKCEVLYLK